MNEGAYSHFSTIYESSLAYLKSYFQANIEQANQIVRLPELAGDEDKFLYLIYEEGGMIGNSFLVKLGEGRSEIVSLVPSILAGVGLQVKITKKVPDEDGLTGGLVCEWYDRTMQFYDPFFKISSTLNIVNQSESIVLAGLAYFLEYAKEEAFSISEGELWEMTKQHRLEDGLSLEEAQKPIRISTKGMSIFLPIPDEPDNMQIRGTIQVARTFEFNDQKLWRLDVLVFQDSERGEANVLPIFVREENFKDGYIPKVGDDVQGVVWLQGVLSRVKAMF